MTECWLDLRSAEPLVTTLCEAAVQYGFDAIVAADPADLASLPPTVTRVLMPVGCELPPGIDKADVVVVDAAIHGEPAELAERYPALRFGRYVEVVDAPSLAAACRSAKQDAVTVLRFRDPTYIPLEIVLAAAANSAGSIITVASGADDAAIHLGVLEHGPDGVMLAPASLAEAGAFVAAVRNGTADVSLVTLEVTGVTYAGMGERACVDTCSYLAPDEGILVGSRSRGLVLCVSETHPLPYMPTRPFRVNAGAVMSYTLADPDHTRYLSELRAGTTVLAVDVHGRTRLVTVGRVKIETRPLLSIDAVGPAGEPVNLILQNDWHVRILGPGGVVLNSTALRPGDQILGYISDHDRHVGYPINERCREQ